MNSITELVLLLDVSGSMHGREADTAGGFNTMTEEQRRTEGEVLVTTVLFSDRTRCLHDRVPLSRVCPMRPEDLRPAGSTALYDAIGDTVRHIEHIHRYLRPEDVPAHTIFVITTDGMENASRHTTHAQLRRLIEQKREEGFTFLFLGADIDAEEVAEDIGIGREHAVTYDAEQNTRAMFCGACEAVTELRCERKLDARWKDTVRRKTCAKPTGK